VRDQSVKLIETLRIARNASAETFPIQKVVVELRKFCPRGREIRLCNGNAECVRRFNDLPKVNHEWTPFSSKHSRRFDADVVAVFDVRRSLAQRRATGARH